MTPFTYRDGASYLEILYALIDYVNDSLRGEIQQILTEKLLAFADELSTTKADWETKWSEFMADVEAELAALNDAAVAGLVNNALSLTGKELREHFPEIVSPMSFGAFGDGVNLDVATIQAAVDATPDNGVLEFPIGKTFALGSGVIEVQAPITIRGGVFTTTSGKAFRVTDSGAKFHGLTITGPGTDEAYVINNAAINVQGASGAYLTDIEVVNCVVTGMRDTGIRMEFVDRFTIIGNRVEDFRYGGILVNSGRNGNVRNNTVKHAVQDTVGLSYGIAISDLANTDVDRSDTVDVVFNYVEDVPDWEGIDTHGGKNINISFNTVKECRNGIVFTVGSDTRTLAPVQCRAVGNFVTAPVLTGIKTTTGIAIGGSSPTNPLHPLMADAVITDNTLFNVTIPVSLSAGTGAQVDRKKSVITDNASNLPVFKSNDTGWVDAEDYGHFEPGYASNSTYPVKMRIVDGVVKFEGVVSLSGGATNNIFFIIDDTNLIPTFDRIMGSGQGTAAPYDQYTLSVNTAGSYRVVFPTSIPTTNFTVTGEYQL